jgi:DNA-binding transcriptional LysR family regulator
MRGAQFVQLTAFAAVAEHLSFSRAAQRLGISRSWLSLNIRTLEAELGVLLLTRTTRNVALTEPGRALMAQLIPVLDGLDQSVDSVRGHAANPQGSLRLRVHPLAAVQVVAPLLGRFSALHPSIALEVAVERAPTDLVGGGFDVGIFPAAGIARDMIATVVTATAALCAVASPDYLARAKPLSAPAELAEHNCIVFPMGDQDVNWRFERTSEVVSVRVRGNLTVGDVHLAARAAVDGVGVAQASEAMVAPYLQQGSLVRLFPAWEMLPEQFLLFRPDRRYVPRPLQLLLDFIRSEARAAVRAGTPGPREG